MTQTTDPDLQPAPEPDKPRGGCLKQIVVFLILVVLAGAGYACYDAYRFMTTPPSAEGKDVIIDIQPGATFDRVAWDMYKEGVITDVTRFRLMAKVRNKLGSVQAGEFALNTGWTPDKVLAQITGGKSLLYKLSLREGLPWWEVARLVEEGGFATAAEFEAVIHDPEFLKQYGIPFANAEGFLYPETYFLRKPKTLGGREQAETVARTLIETFWKRSWPALVHYAAADTSPGGSPVLLPHFVLKNNVPVRLPAQAASAQPQQEASGAAVHERAAVPALQAPVSAETLRYVVTLASLVEKETGVPAERGRVAGVYANRLRIGMLLQCDPTIIYGVGKKHSGPIRRSQLEDAGNLYNTYKHPGLPPGPICSPGAASTRAAVQPEAHKFLYFVATGKPDGTHTFSTNLRDHERAVKVYRATQRR